MQNLVELKVEIPRMHEPEFMFPVRKVSLHHIPEREGGGERGEGERKREGG